MKYMKSSNNGGGFSREGMFSYGMQAPVAGKTTWKTCMRPGRRELRPNRGGLCGVFNGHGGPHASQYVQQNLFNTLIRHHKLMSDTRAAIVDACNLTDSEFPAKYPKIDDGSTTTAAA